MDNKVFLLGLFLLSVANVKAQTQTQNDSLTMENMMHNLPEIMVKGSRQRGDAYHQRTGDHFNARTACRQIESDACCTVG